MQYRFLSISSIGSENMKPTIAVQALVADNFKPFDFRFHFFAVIILGTLKAPPGLIPDFTFLLLSYLEPLKASMTVRSIIPGVNRSIIVWS